MRPLPALALSLVTAVGLLACAGGVQWRNLEPAQQAAREREAPAGSVQAGWRVYQQRCAACHGDSASAGGPAPDLTFSLRDLGPQRFVDLVLRRYDWTRPDGIPGSARDTLVDEIVERRRGELVMPAWEGEPMVTVHIMDLYAYLSARAQGTLGPGRPR